MASFYGVGDIIEYQPLGGGIRRVRVVNVEDDIKNGEAGFDGVVVNPDGSEQDPDDFGGVWGYDWQIVRVVGRAK